MFSLTHASKALPEMETNCDVTQAIRDWFGLFWAHLGACTQFGHIGKLDTHENCTM